MGNTICGAKDRQFVIPPADSLQKKAIFESECSEILQPDLVPGWSTILNLSFKCTNLSAENRFQLLSPMAEIQIKSQETTLKSLETEVQPNTLTAFFTKTVNVPFSLSSDLQVYVTIWDVPNKKSKSLLGSNSFSLHELASRKDFITKELFLNEKRNGNLLACAKEVKDYNTVVTMKWSFDNKVPLKKIYFLRLSNCGKNNVPVFQSETKAPPLAWSQFEIDLGTLCKANQGRQILAEIVELGPDLQIIGSVSFTISQLSTCKSLQIKHDNSTIGFLILDNFSSVSKSTFLDYTRSDVELCPFYTIDFSEKLGHSNEKLEENEYLKCVQALQQNLQFYTQDPLYTVLGTGAQFQGITKPCFCFALNGNIFQPEVVNHSNLKTYYQSTLSGISPADKTNFSEVLEVVIKYIKNEPSDIHKYYSVFIISAADPFDVDEIVGKFSIVNELPLSIFVMKVNNDLLLYENLAKAKKAAMRPFFDIVDVNDVNQALNLLEKHIVNYAEYKDINYFKQNERVRTRSNSLKLSPEKVRTRTNYFTKAKAEYIEYLVSIGYSSEKIDEINQLGTPFVMLNIDPNENLPHRTRTKTISVKHKSVKSTDLTCLNCSIVVSRYVELPCGCKYYCTDCVTKCECPGCQ